MANKKVTHRALYMSIISLILCCALLVGTTLAWFTDTVTSGSNVITSGNLDIEVEYTLDGKEWANLDGADDLFQIGLWEPGHTEVAALRITNKGSLALKYTASMNIVEETPGTNKAGEEFKLSDILTVSTYVVGPFEAGWFGDMMASSAISGVFDDGIDEPDKTVAFNAANILYEGKEIESDGQTFPCYLTEGQSAYVFVQVDMAETVGNEANHDGTNAPSINFGINVYATQTPYEYDSFGKDYDKDAEYANKWQGNAATPDELAAVTDDEAKTIKINSPELLAAFANAVNEGNTYGNYTVSLEQDIDLNNLNWTPIGDETNFFRGVFDGQGHTISNLRCNGGAANPTNVNARYQGLFGYMYTNGSDYVCDIINLTLNNVDIYAASSAGAFVGAVDAQPGRYWFQVGQVTLKNLKLTGKVTIEGNYSGGVAGGKSDTWPGLVALVNVEVNVADGSYVSNVVASAGSDSHAVGGVIAIAPYGVKQDITSNIDVIGNAGTVGGIAAVGGFDWTNVTCTGDVTVKNATEATYMGNGTVIGKLVPQSAAPGEIVNISGTGNLRIEIGDEIRTTNGQESNTIGCLAW